MPQSEGFLKALASALWDFLLFKTCWEAMTHGMRTSAMAVMALTGLLVSCANPPQRDVVRDSIQNDAPVAKPVDEWEESSASNDLSLQLRDPNLLEQLEDEVGTKQKSESVVNELPRPVVIRGSDLPQPVEKQKIPEPPLPKKMPPP